MTSTLPIPIQTIDELSNGFQGFITTGDKYLDDALGGGLCPGTITEFVGSSSTGKTQLALQLLLMVQLPRSEGGLGGSACYLTNTDALPTQRLVDIQANHPQLSTLSIEDAFARIETAAITTLTKLVRVLEAIPQVGARLADKLGSPPLRLLVIDSIDVVFNDYVKTTDKTLFTRSKDLNEVALLLHRLASEHDLAILVINGVHSVFSSNRPSLEDRHGSIIYLDQARWFARGDSASFDGPVEAALGLVWANQIGTRVMLTRTGRRRKHVHKFVTPPSKRRLIASDNGHASPTTPSSPPPPLSSSSVKEAENMDSEEMLSIRQFSVLFSQFAPPATLDYIITSAGVVSLNSQDT